MNTLRNSGVRCVSRIKCYGTLQKLVTPKVLFSRTNHDDSINNNNKDNVTKQEMQKQYKDVSSAMLSKYQVFKDEDATVILDVAEERMKHSETQELTEDQERIDEIYGLTLERGVRGVFDIEELVAVLRKEKLSDIFVASLPPELKYVDYIVVVTGMSTRHMLSVAEFVKKMYKRKRHHYDLIPKIEGENSKDWIALDLGNIALHIFSKNARPVYDLESLWTVGSQYDLAYNKPEDPVIALLKQHSIYLGDLHPADGVAGKKVLE